MTVVPTTPSVNNEPTPAAVKSSNVTTNLGTVGVILGSVACGAVGQLILKAGMNSLGPLQPSIDTFIHMVSNPLLISGRGCFRH